MSEEEAKSEPKGKLVQSMGVKGTMLVGVSEEGFSCNFRIRVSEWESKESFTCPVNMKTYDKKDLTVAQTYEDAEDSK